MTAVSIRFSNSNVEPIYLQVDPWAGFYLLQKGEKIEIVAESETTSPSFEIYESGTTRILSIWDSAENGYYVVLNGQRIHWTEYQLDGRLCAFCLGLLNSEEALGKVCTCG
jgi:hypothetical protein